MLIVNSTSFIPAALEFIYAQSPYSMKGLLVGLFFCRLGVGVAVAGVIFLGVPDSEYLCLLSASSGYSVTNNCIFLYYILFIGVGIIAFILFTVTAVLYRNRRRDHVVNENAAYQSTLQFHHRTRLHHYN